MTKEQKFYKALQDVFIGAKVEGEGGFVNLMRIKSNYYRKIEDILKKDIESALKSHPKFRDELFDKLYSFFSRYFTESGSIYFNSTPFHNNIYEKVYTDEKDVILFWKTQMLYYVKTDRIFRSLPVDFDGFKFYFDASKIESKKANEKRSLIFELSKVREDETIVFSVSYSEKGTKTKQDEILKAIKRKGIAITEEQLERAFRVFEKQSEVDFFINKNAKAFLEEQFKLWSYQYFWEGAKEWGADRVNQLQILKDIAFKIVDFISQFEDELVKIWNKPKFVKNSNYVITLDKIADKKLVEKIKKHKNFSEQVKEWKELGIDKDNPKTPIDTKYFKDLELEILSQFEDLDKSLDGWLIKSENYQALNTILPKFKEKVQTIYIDPPFNLDSSDQFLYRTNYKDANWATLLENRLRTAKDILKRKTGSIFVRCDDNGNWIMRYLMSDIFGPLNFRNEIDIKRNQALPKTGDVNLIEETENLFVYAPDSDFIFRNQLVDREKPYWGDLGTRPSDKKDNPSRFIGGIEFKPPAYRRWSYSQENLSGMYKNKRLKIEDGKLKVLIDKRRIGSNWTDIPGYSATPIWGFSTENSEKLLSRVIDMSSEKGDFIFDFFVGSGTTTAVAHKLGRKWIGVELGEHFNSYKDRKGITTGIVVRMKEVLAGQGNHEPYGISRELNWQGGGFFKYYELEQYEEALANCKYGDSDLFNSPSKTPYQEYVFMKDG
ncbi:MAG: site-specific DNA-methyltransferase [Ignavibacteria bacterium]|nr:site-specific DNA-methyltransferase [Ignavibacteria bacterium]